MSTTTGIHVRPHCNLAKDGSTAFIRLEPVEPAHTSYTIAAKADELALLIVNLQKWLDEMGRLQRAAGKPDPHVSVSTAFSAVDVEPRTIDGGGLLLNFKSEQGGQLPVALSPGVVARLKHLPAGRGNPRAN